MPYSALSWVSLKRTAKRSTQSMKMPSPSKPFTVKPVTLGPTSRLARSSRQVAGSTSGGAIAMP